MYSITNTQSSVVEANQHVMAALRRTLLRIADEEDARAANEAARVRYWEPPSISVLAHRTAAAALRDEAQRVELLGRSA